MVKNELFPSFPDPTRAISPNVKPQPSTQLTPPITNVILLANWREFRRRSRKDHRKISQCQCQPKVKQKQMRKSLTLRSTLKTERNISRALEMQTKIHTRTNSSVLTELMSSERNLMENAKRMELSKTMWLFNLQAVFSHSELQERSCSSLTWLVIPARYR